MKIKILEENNERLKFIIDGLNIELLNSLRRICMSEVPVMAIKEVEFRKNSSALYDEIIAHRLGLIPLKTDLKSYNFVSECSCKGKTCAKCSVKLSLKEVGPKTVYASDMKSTDPEIKPVFPKMPIVKLLEGQELEFTAIAILGRGIEHAKFSPCLATYRYYPKIEIDSKACNQCKKCVDACPKGILSISGKEIVINEKTLLDCDLCRACEDACKPKAIKLIDNPNKVIFEIESWGQLKPKEIFINAIRIMEEKLKEFSSAIKEKA
ncbi:MAG: DNA-directed RNA polymerase subunit D [Candidatus Parvarchaeota archaeon]|nr:DNA-directed RNA polymerase subunit D [Candidatus Jingweiarchaeum tengchongense]MCW1298147.1 DNA-directed RNA polymerase subunit D [Candidatus Jingweiarchaeum tengchongense]MCW1299946.1 DNA-directed RNA polymerase subunit D [Candidatus Jingweiarchaeum tengchongense]MCW1305069.1 DNA-directed RNA polymerase subunit D [Candidatus Jingweiarchaeum tengchongense]MCW1305568.1 DNA-directed RNA polymerase subunit D [Candidatus Jingweiarchaeum tengchongense]